MSFLTTLHGTLALLLLCGLIFAEEVGVPLPLLPGDLLLVGAGVLIAGGNLAGYAFVPLSVAAAVAGAMVGYTWARAVGHPGLTRVAARLGATEQLDRVSLRLRSARPWTIFLARLIPGLRINTTLVAGSLRVPRRTFALGLIPAVCVWTFVFTGLGFAVGLPLQGVLRKLDQLMLQGTFLVAMGAVTYVVIRRMPASRAREQAGMARVGRGWRIAGAIAIDLGTIGSVVAGLNTLLRVALRVQAVDDWVDVLTTVLATGVVYAVITRLGGRTTAGEAVFGASYVAGHRRRRVSDVKHGHGHPDDSRESGNHQPADERDARDERRDHVHHHVDHG